VRISRTPAEYAGAVDAPELAASNGCMSGHTEHQSKTAAADTGPRIPSEPARPREAFIKIVDSAGNASMASLAMLKNGDVNRWRGWKCAVGIHTIHIAPDGRVEGAACHAGGALGNVFTGFDLKTAWLECDVDLCYCSDDIQLPKLAPGVAPKAFHAPVNDKASLQQLTGVGHEQFIESRGEFRVNWNLGKRCNFNCSYCPSSIHDNHSLFVPESAILEGAKLIFSKIPQQQRIRFTFTGGEPTLHPAYLKLVKTVAERPKTIIATNTNGTRHAEYLSELNQLSALYISVHFEFTQLEKLARKLEHLNRNLRNRIIVKIMAAPGNLERVSSFFETLDAIPDRKFSISVEPLVLKAGSGPAALGYSKEERAAIQALARRGFR
jgi:MoaA/NifB/PqqE/SkfB family radical SAM enzyme